MNGHNMCFSEAEVANPFHYNNDGVRTTDSVEPVSDVIAVIYPLAGTRRPLHHSARRVSLFITSLQPVYTVSVGLYSHIIMYIFG